MAASTGQKPETDRPGGDDGSSPQGQAPKSAKKISFPTKEAQRRAKLRQDAKRDAEREARLEDRRISRDLAQFKLEQARVDAIGADRQHELESRRQEDGFIARANADALRIEVVRANIRLRQWLLPCVYLGIAALGLGLYAGHLTETAFKIGCTAIGGLVIVLLRDQFGFSLRVRLRTQFWSWMQRALRRRSNRRDIESLLMPSPRKPQKS